MKLKITTASLIAASAPAGAVAFAQDADMDRSHPKAFVKDSAITTKIKTKLAADNVKSLAHVHVDTDMNGVVWLSGTVPTEGDAERAVRIAKDTDGVVGVKNGLQVRHD
jgi:hyperosmotically inducible protein